MVTVADSQPGFSSEDGNLRIMPETAHEVSATLLLTLDGRKIPIGNIPKNFDDLADVMVRLGTKVSDGYPSSIGFRVFLRTDVPKSRERGSIEDYYHLVSCKFDPQGGEVSYTHATKEDKRELVEAQPFRKSPETDLIFGTDQDLYRMDFITSDTNGFIISRHKPALRTSNGQIKKVEKLLPFIAYTTKLSVFFIADKLLEKYLGGAIKQNCVGTVPPSWKTALPDSAIPRWPSNVQTRMVAGSIDVYNVLLGSLHEKPLQDGPGTLVSERPEATRFRDFVRETYPNVRQEASNKVYPVMLDVSDGGLCVELPFGASMLNRGNTYAAINALHRLLAAGIASEHIGIVTLYPAQVEAYQDALNRCHRHAPLLGYDLVQVGLLEAWVDKTVGVAIVDLVRTPNASGNLGYLSQATRLKVLLTLHRNGLVVVGDRGCTVTPHGSKISAKLDKVLQWFVDNGRTVRISDTGLPQSSESQPSQRGPSTDLIHPKTGKPLPKLSQVSSTNPSLSSTSSNASDGHTSSVSSANTLKIARKFVGIPGLEHFRIDGPVNENARVPPGRKNEGQDSEATLESFVRQGFINIREAPSRPEPKQLPPSTNAGIVHASYLHKVVPKSEVVSPHSKPEPGLKINAGASFRENIAPKKEMKSQKPNKITMEASAHEVHEPRSSSVKEAASKGTNPLSLSSAKSKAQDLLTSPTEIQNTDIDARFEAVTNRFKMEFGSDVFQSIMNESQSKLSNLADRGISRRAPASLTDPRNATLGMEISSVNAHKEDDKPMRTSKEASPQRLCVQLEAASPQQTPRVKSPPDKSPVKVSSTHPSQAASEEKCNIGEVSSGQSLLSRSPTRASDGFADRNEDTISRPNGNGHLTAGTRVGQEAEQKPDFKTLYQQKYRAIRSLFANMADTPRDKSGEDQLFRRLAEAFVDEDVEAFERVYTKLLGMAAGLQTHCLRRT